MSMWVLLCCTVGVKYINNCIRKPTLSGYKDLSPLIKFHDMFIDI